MGKEYNTLLVNYACSATDSAGKLRFKIERHYADICAARVEASIWEFECSLYLFYFVHLCIILLLLFLLIVIFCINFCLERINVIIIGLGRKGGYFLCHVSATCHRLTDAEKAAFSTFWFPLDTRPGTISVNVDACKTSRSIHPSTFNRLAVIQTLIPKTTDFYHILVSLNTHLAQSR